MQFLGPILKDGSFDGKIVVGSPDPHGPFKTSARDGHYASFLTFFLGQYAEPPDEFPIKLDVDVKVEKEEKNNLILVGGPGTNLLTQEINNYLPIRFNMTLSEYGFLFSGLVSEKTKNVYTADAMGLIAKIVNPWDKEKRVIVFELLFETRVDVIFDDSEHLDRRNLLVAQVTRTLDRYVDDRFREPGDHSGELWNYSIVDLFFHRGNLLPYLS